MDELKEIREEIRKVGLKNIEKAKKTHNKFYLGDIRISDEIKKKGYTLSSEPLAEIFERFKNCDWGYDNEDVKINENSIKTGYGDVLGIYEIDGIKIWIQTDFCEDTVTTIFLPEER